MAGFEVIVRPVIFPNIRPTARQSLPAPDDPSKGFAVIRGNPASSGQVTSNYSASGSSSSPAEEHRIVDVMRVYQKEDSGEINRENYVDVDVATKVAMDMGPKGKENWKFNEPQASENEEVLQRNKKRAQGFIIE